MSTYDLEGPEAGLSGSTEYLQYPDTIGWQSADNWINFSAYDFKKSIVSKRPSGKCFLSLTLL